MLTKTLSLIMAATLLLSMPHAVEARRNDQGDAREDVRNGKVKKLHEIVEPVKKRMKGMQYITSEYDPVALVYRLKFIDKDRVRFVDVDAQTGKIISQR